MTEASGTPTRTTSPRSAKAKALRSAVPEVTTLIDAVCCRHLDDE